MACDKDPYINGDRTVDGSEILHQLRLVVYPIIDKVSYIPGGAGFLNHQQYDHLNRFFYK